MPGYCSDGIVCGNINVSFFKLSPMIEKLDYLLSSLDN